MEGDKSHHDQSGDIKSNEGHSDEKLLSLYHSKLIGAAKMLTRILHKHISSSSTKHLDETESKAKTIKSCNSLE